jgi:hypothetical protein
MFLFTDIWRPGILQEAHLIPFSTNIRASEFSNNAACPHLMYALGLLKNGINVWEIAKWAGCGLTDPAWSLRKLLLFHTNFQKVCAFWAPHPRLFQHGRRYITLITFRELVLE